MLIRNAAIFIVARGGAGLLTFLALSLFTRLLSPAEFGRYALVNAGIAFASSVGFSWLRMAVLRFHGAQRGDREALRATALAGYLGAVALTLVATAAISVRFSSVGVGLIAVGFLVLCAQTWYELNLDFLTARQEPKRYGLYALARSALALAVAGTLAARGMGAMGLLVGALAGYALPSVWAIATSWRSVSLRAADRGLLTDLVRYGLPFTAAFALEYVVSTSDRILLGAYHDSRAVGEYAAPYDLAQQSLGMLMIAVNLAAYPMAVQAYESGGAEAARAHFRRHATVLAALAIPAAVGLSLLARSVTSVFLGPEFREVGTAVLPWIVAGSLLLFGKAYYLDLAFQLSRNMGRQVAASALGAVVNTALNVILIPRHGVMGAAYSTLLAYAVAFVASARLGRGVCPLPVPWGPLLRVVAATGVMAAVLVPQRRYTGPGALAVQVSLGAAAYAVAAVLFDVGGVRGMLRSRLAGGRVRVGGLASRSP
jgi:O-antigen/teichoic acid export membrane protein